MDTSIDTQVDIATLLEIFELPMNCESETHIGGDTTCSGEVTHQLTIECRKRPFNVCSNVGNLADEYIKSEDYICVYCDRNMQLCWSVRVI